MHIIIHLLYMGKDFFAAASLQVDIEFGVSICQEELSSPSLVSGERLVPSITKSHLATFPAECSDDDHLLG